MTDYIVITSGYAVLIALGLTAALWSLGCVAQFGKYTRLNFGKSEKILRGSDLERVGLSIGNYNVGFFKFSKPTRGDRLCPHCSKFFLIKEEDYD